MNPTGVFVVTTSVLYLIKTGKLQRIYRGLTGQPGSFVDTVIEGINVPQPSGLDPNVIKFIVALTLVSILVEVISRFSEGAAWTLVIILILGFLYNNPYAVAMITMGANSLEEAAS